MTAIAKRVTPEQMAWDEYLQATRNLVGAEYEAVEPFAWIRLKKAIKKGGKP